jgi:hypothetical protein
VDYYTELNWWKYSDLTDKKIEKFIFNF